MRQPVQMLPKRLDEMTSGNPARIEERLVAYGTVVWPNDAEQPILTPPVRAALFQWLYEMNAADELQAVGLKPRQRALLSGPPGCGKTTLAHHIAARLGVPLLVVQTGQVISSSIGATGSNISRMFAEVRRAGVEVGIFLDEFEALANKRGKADQAAAVEFNNIVIALLQEIDRHKGLLFAATNLADNIDPAIWRRFELQIEIGLPGSDERFAIAKRYLDPFAADDDTVSGIAEALDGAAPALIREACEYIKRSLVLGPRMGLDLALEAIMARFVTSAAPSENMPTPRLWSDPRAELTQLATLPWPPERVA